MLLKRRSEDINQFTIRTGSSVGSDFGVGVCWNSAANAGHDLLLQSPAALLRCAASLSEEWMRRIVTDGIVDISYSLKWID